MSIIRALHDSTRQFLALPDTIQVALVMLAAIVVFFAAFLAFVAWASNSLSAEIDLIRAEELRTDAMRGEK